MVAPLVVGLAGSRLTDAERIFLEQARPFGVILFTRNIGGEDALRRLVDHVRTACDPLVFVDQEGGRVQRLVPPLAPRYPAAARFGALYTSDPGAARRAAYLAGFLIGADLQRFSIDSPALPVADVPAEDAHDVIGDRAFSRDPAAVASLARAAADGVLAAGALPVVKHVPGHGRARADSHAECPVVDVPRDALERDFAPFRALRHLPMAMTAHVRFTALDAQRPATLSPAVLRCVREDIGFTGLLLSDDIVMGALGRDRVASGVAALRAGCDGVLHCSGNLAEMEALAAACPDMDASRLAPVMARRGGCDPGEEAAARDEFDRLLQRDARA